MGPRLYLYWNVMNVKSSLSKPRTKLILLQDQSVLVKKKSFASLCLMFINFIFIIAGGL